uniref:Uncharacterized protein n=1 Tax=Desertifilum tharense IPPAS B-1220 TaxID=1781255 RepID=A0ACD5GPD3_9CYAN
MGVGSWGRRGWGDGGKKRMGGWGGGRIGGRRGSWGTYAPEMFNERPGSSL